MPSASKTRQSMRGHLLLRPVPPASSMARIVRTRAHNYGMELSRRSPATSRSAASATRNPTLAPAIRLRPSAAALLSLVAEAPTWDETPIGTARARR